jgi:hypothetical protein
MKKILALLTLAVSLPACTVNEFPGSYVVSETYYLTVYPNDWRTENANGNFYIFAEQNLSAITRDVIENGTVLAYYVGDYDNLLPYLRSYAIGSFEVIRYDLQERRITFIIESNDPTLPQIPENYTMEFKVVVLRNQYN